MERCPLVLIERSSSSIGRQPPTNGRRDHTRVHVSDTKRTLRLSVHLFNTAGQIETALAALHA